MHFFTGGQSGQQCQEPSVHQTAGPPFLRPESQRVPLSHPLRHVQVQERAGLAQVIQPALYIVFTCFQGNILFIYDYKSSLNP